MTDGSGEGAPCARSAIHRAFIPPLTTPPFFPFPLSGLPPQTGDRWTPPGVPLCLICGLPLAVNRQAKRRTGMDVCAAVAVYRKVSSTAAAPRIMYAPSHRTTAMSNAVSAHSRGGVGYWHAWAARAILPQARFSCYIRCRCGVERGAFRCSGVPFGCPVTLGLDTFLVSTARQPLCLRPGGNIRPFISPDIVLVLHIRKACSPLPPSLSHTNSNTSRRH